MVSILKERGQKKRSYISTTAEASVVTDNICGRNKSTHVHTICYILQIHSRELQHGHFTHIGNLISIHFGLPECDLLDLSER